MRGLFIFHTFLPNKPTVISINSFFQIGKSFLENKQNFYKEPEVLPNLLDYVIRRTLFRVFWKSKSGTAQVGAARTAQ